MFTARGLNSGFTQVLGNVSQSYISCWNLIISHAHRNISFYFAGIILVANKCLVHLVMRTKMLKPSPHGYEFLVFLFSFWILLS